MVLKSRVLSRCFENSCSSVSNTQCFLNCLVVGPVLKMPSYSSWWPVTRPLTPGLHSSFPLLDQPVFHEFSHTLGFLDGTTSFPHPLDLAFPLLHCLLPSLASQVFFLKLFALVTSDIFPLTDANVRLPYFSHTCSSLSLESRKVDFQRIIRKINKNEEV